MILKGLTRICKGWDKPPPPKSPPQNPTKTHLFPLFKVV